MLCVVKLETVSATLDTMVTVRDGQGWITGVPPELQKPLEDATKFRPAGFQFSPKYNAWVGSGKSKKRKWDGWIRLARNGRFPAGLVSRICAVLEAHDVEYTLDVERPREFDTIRCEVTGIEKRDYQDRAVEAALLNPRGIIRAPTGSGKTAVGARIVAGRAKRAVIVVPTIDLLYQYSEFLSEHLVLDGTIGQLGDGTVDPQEVTVATIRTMAKAMQVAYQKYEYAEYDDKDDTKVNPLELREWLEGIATLIVDEAHVLGAQVVYDMATKLKAPNKYGMSASPWRDDGADLMIEAATGPVIDRIGTAELVAEGYLVPPVIRSISTKGWWMPAAWQKNQWADCYREEIVENTVRNTRIAEIVNELEGPTLVLVKQVKHGRALESQIEGARFLHGGDQSQIRKEAFAAMREGSLQVVIATTIADMGLDLPICRNLVLAAGGKSSTRHLQRIGRVARPYPGKESALVIDFDDSHVHKWFASHVKARRKIEHAEWAETALWI